MVTPLTRSCYWHSNSNQIQDQIFKQSNQNTGKVVKTYMVFSLRYFKSNDTSKPFSF